MDSTNEAVSKWLQSKFLDWQRETGKLQNIKDFANYLEIPYPSFHKYITGKRIPTIKAIVKLANILGFEIFVLLGVIPKDAEYQNMLNLYSKLNKEQRKAVLEYGESLMTKYVTRAKKI